jgi:hypothetical protein
MAKHEYPVEVQTDFLERQTKALPVQAVAELIWNSLDADATQIDIEFGSDRLGGMSTISIGDNGHGIPYLDAPGLFRNLGGSWKKRGALTKEKKRFLHGQDGQGRFKAFALGRVADWKVVYKGPNGLQRYEITIIENEIKKVVISDEVPFSGGKTGTTVVISELKRQFPSLSPENSLQDFSEIFAIYLKHYRDVQIRISGERIDPETAIDKTWEVQLTPITDDTGQIHPVSLEVIGWRRQTKRALYLCNERGIPLSQVEARFHVGEFQFSGYLKSTFINQLHSDNRLDLAEMVPTLQHAIEEARDQIKIIYRERAAERARIVVDQWKANKLYPFEGEAITPVEKAERQIFDIVAVTVQEAAPEYREAPRPQLALHLRMLRQAIERSPSELQKILDEVLKLPAKTQKQLANLLEETTLSGIISAAGIVADRLKFLSGLEAILFDPDMKKRLRERTQLHKILETNTWIFGEEFNLWVSDRSLTEVLRQHRDKLDPDIVIDEPVKHVSQERGIVDLMLSRAQKKHRADDVEHLVVELKAPKVALTAKEISQLEGYAASVADDARFRTIGGLRWHFWLVSDEYNKDVGFRLKGHPEGRFGIVSRSDNITVGIKTWGQIIEDNRARLQFFQEKLEHRIDQSGALKALQEKHAKFLEGVIVDEVPEPTDKDASDSAQNGKELGQPIKRRRQGKKK